MISQFFKSQIKFVLVDHLQAELTNLYLMLNQIDKELHSLMVIIIIMKMMIILMVLSTLSSLKYSKLSSNRDYLIKSIIQHLYIFLNDLFN